MRAKRFVPPSMLLLLVAATFAGGQEERARPDAHGRFTGQIKAVVYVSDVEASAPFYRDVLGFEFRGFAGPDDDPYYAEMVAGGVKFGLHEPTSEGQNAKVGTQRLYFRLEDLEAHRERVVARGVEPGEIRRTDWMDMFLVRDPDGNEIVFAVTDPDRHGTDPWSGGSRGKTGEREEP